MHWVSLVMLLTKHKKGYVEGEPEDGCVMQLELFVWYHLQFSVVCISTSDHSKLAGSYCAQYHSSTSISEWKRGFNADNADLRPSLADLYLASVGCSTIFRSTFDRTSAAAPLCGAILSKANASFCASVGSSSSAAWTDMQLESDVQATMPYVLILASCHDTAPELL